MSKNKKYKDFTAEEKAEYKAKRDAYLAKREEDKREAFRELQEQLKKLKAGDELMALVERCKGKPKAEGSNRETYLTAMFGTEEPKIGQTASYLYIGVRGPNGERMNANETMGQFVTRVGDCNYKYDANTISSMIWYLRKRGHIVENDKTTATCTFKGFEKVAE